jgi:hypothetical protein
MAANTPRTVFDGYLPEVWASDIPAVDDRGLTAMRDRLGQ